ncbi:DUF4349 domain-containing protein [Alkalihalobacterium elongatum]|uniref:DUF4349 domain-containing protein n=1 Tax=Alkalihalobacterium elongatum TaxID=2675466 RepID=UPI001C200E8F|nr:DUF4349 domain-containing protein [Alkalihalobacterium elongatum]
MRKTYVQLLVLIAILGICILFSACSSHEYRTEMSEDAGEMDMVAEVASYSGGATRGVTSEKEIIEDVSVSDDENLSGTAAERMVIYNAHLSIEVNDYHQSEAAIQERVKKLGGFVIESSVYRSGEQQIHGNLIVKVPQKHFQAFLTEVESTSVKVIDRMISGNDVTEEYVDLESRLRSKRVVEKRLLAFMEDAENTEDLLKISSDLAKVQEEIEQILGRMNYLEKNVEFSTVTIYLQENKVNVPSIQGNDLNTWEKSKSLFMASTNNTIALFSGLVVLLIGLSPIFIPVTIIALIIIYKLRKRPKNTEKL